MSGSKRFIHPHNSMRDAILRVFDSAVIIGSLYLAFRIVARPLGETDWLFGLLAVLLHFVTAEFTSLYRSWRGSSADREILCATLTWSITFVLLLAQGLLTRSATDLPRSGLLCWWLAVPALSGFIRLSIRTLQRMFRARGYNTRTFAIVGVTDLGIQLAKNIEGLPGLGLKLTGFYDDRPDERNPQLPEAVGQKVGNLDALVAAAKDGTIDLIYITFPMRAEDRIRDVLTRLSDSTASVYVVPDFFVFQLLHSRWSSIDGLPVVSVFENPFYGVDGFVKRLCDFFLALAATVLLALPMLLIALLIKRGSKGPVFFRQRRYGLDGQEIKVWKFRTMTVCEDGDNVEQAKRGDSRITPLGAFLRKTSLDELPQLFNVLDGSMSLVGPRPHASAHNEKYRAMIQGYMLRHKVKPGITGLAQVSGWRGETDTPEKMEKRVEFDHRYIREWSLWLDVRILFKTISVVLRRQNAY